MRNNKLFEWALTIILMCFVVGLIYDELEYKSSVTSPVLKA